MATTKKIIQKDAQGNVIEVDIGANATNITQDSTHRFVTDTEKTIWNAKQNAITIDTALSSSSTNPVQNKVVNTALAGKASSSHTHSNYVNQNAFSNVKVGSTTIAADNITDILTLEAGSNVTLTADATNDKITISATDTKYTHPSYTSKTNALYKVTIDGTGHVSATSAVTKADITALGIPAQDTKYTHPTTSGNKHIPESGSDGSILVWDSAGTAKWHSLGNDTIDALSHIKIGPSVPTRSCSLFNQTSVNLEKFNNSVFIATKSTQTYPGTLSQVTCIGYGAKITGSNQVQLGGQDSTTYTYGAVQNRSDRRDKTDIENTDLGLEFIKELRPVRFRWNYREDYTEYIETQHENDGSKKRKRFHQGLIAQEVKETMDKLGVDFGGYQDHSINGGKDVLSIGYEELIPVLIKAVQEQQQQIDDLTRIIREK